MISLRTQDGKVRCRATIQEILQNISFVLTNKLAIEVNPVLRKASESALGIASLRLAYCLIINPTAETISKALRTSNLTTELMFPGISYWIDSFDELIIDEYCSMPASCIFYEGNEHPHTPGVVIWEE